MLVYGFHEGTGEFTGYVSTMRDPLSGRDMAPWNTTLLIPPAAGENQKAVFSEGAWRLVADHRGEIWYDGRTPVRVEVLGEPVGLAPEPTPLTLDEQWAAVRVQRDAMLAASDWTQVADVPLSGAEVAAWRVYRQALRDTPVAFDDPSNVTWPETP